MSNNTRNADRFPLLEGVRALNIGSGLVAAMAGKLIGDLGAAVTRARLSAQDPAGEFYPAYEALRAHEGAATVDEIEALEQLASTMDICIVGGEDFPEMAREEGLVDRLAAANPRLIILDLQAYPPGYAPDGKAIDILVQARSGLVFEHYPDRPNLMAFQPTHYGAALQGVGGVIAALVARGRQGLGQIVSTSLFEGALTWVTTWNEAERPDQGFNFVVPLDPRPLILKCADGDCVHLVLGAANSKYALYQLLGIHDPSVLPGDSGTPKRHDPPEKFYGDWDLIAPLVETWRRDDLLAALAKAGIAAAVVQPPGKAWDDPQTIDQRLVTTAPDGAQFVGNSIKTAVVGPVVGPEPDRVGAMPLEGVRVLDFGVFTAGPLSSMLLRKLGADVIKIEPLTGDPSRNMPRANMAANRGKRSIAIDMKTAKGRALVERLCETADVVASNFRTGVAAKLGIDGPSLLARYPRLIVLESPAFGQTGPRATEVAFDLIMQAFCGFEVRAGGRGNRPLWNRTFLSDYGGGHLGALGVMAALHHRQMTGRGALVEASLFGAAFFLQSEIVRGPEGGFQGADLLNPHQTGFRPSEALYQARRGWIALAIRSERAATALRDILGIASLPRDWRTWDDAVAARIAGSIACQDVDELRSVLARAGINAEKCRSGMERSTLNSPILAELGIVERAEDPQYGTIVQMGSLVRLSRSPLASPAPAPMLGQHGADILASLGFNSDEVGALRRERVVG
jgi:crotonobetainyl-CoA:carnitine CoA-transferase CaiB-like acyl-CoA transferase